MSFLRYIEHELSESSMILTFYLDPELPEAYIIKTLGRWINKDMIIKFAQTKSVCVCVPLYVCGDGYVGMGGWGCVCGD